MNSDSMMCNYCGNDIMIYYNSRYNGKRGKCESCNTDFPLE